LKESQGKVLPFHGAENHSSATATWRSQVRVAIKDREPDPDFEDFLVSLGVELWLAKQNKKSARAA
jgi:hypothetical protein